MNEVIWWSPKMFHRASSERQATTRLPSCNEVIDGDVTTSVSVSRYCSSKPRGETPFILSFAVAAVADLNDDARMEIILDSTYYEGSRRRDRGSTSTTTLGLWPRSDRVAGSDGEPVHRPDHLCRLTPAIELTDASADHAEAGSRSREPSSAIWRGARRGLLHPDRDVGVHRCRPVGDGERDGGGGRSEQSDRLSSGPPADGALLGEATPIHRGRTQQLWQVTVTREGDGKLAARGQVRLQNVSSPRIDLQPGRKDGTRQSLAWSRHAPIGPLQVDPPVVLAPMAGVTNAPFRQTVPGIRSGAVCVGDDRRPWPGREK